MSAIWDSANWESAIWDATVGGYTYVIMTLDMFIKRLKTISD